MEAVAVMKVDGSAPFTITAFPVGLKLMTCPSTVRTPPGVKVCVPITRSDWEFSVKVDDPTTKIGADVADGAAVIGPVLGLLDGNGRVMTSPPVVIALPGKRVWLPMTKPDAEFAVMLVPPTTTTAGPGVEVGAESDSVSFAVGVAPLIMIAPPELTDTCSPLMVATAPGVRVWEPIMTLEEASVLAVKSPISIPGGRVVEVAAAGPDAGRSVTVSPAVVDAPAGGAVPEGKAVLSGTDTGAPGKVVPEGNAVVS